LIHKRNTKSGERVSKGRDCDVDVKNEKIWAEDKLQYATWRIDGIRGVARHAYCKRVATKHKLN